ncbi:MAG TPA: MarR family transcriptional regulator [Aurantimonas coralicida]|uniref:MarR family transcriptional regulator n=2 Tax=root TaxID=1 RepID=A0A9C9TGW0_9HYPH|nr:MarR family transcriptional regulator [Aurantimonas coralicida]HEU00604.1 MarR family transcriptional regulator [Aurantimonas coralicida]
MDMNITVPLVSEARMDPGQSLAILPSLLSIAKSTRAFQALLLAEIGLHPGQDQLLDSLDPANPTSVSMLADRLSVRPSTVSKMLDRLIDRGLVARTPNIRDARQTMVQLTPMGEEAQVAIRDIWHRLEDDLATSIPSGDIAALNRSLMHVGEILAQKLRRLR